MKSICLTTTQVRTMIDKCESVLFLTMEEQPEIIPQGAMLRSCGINAILINPRTGESMVDTDYPFVVGERCWVRETWRLKTGSDYEHSSLIFYEDNTSKLIHWRDGHQIGQKYGLGLTPDKQRPSIHMPRWASRLTIEVVAIKAMQIQDISEDDIRAEGVGGMRDLTWASPLGNISTALGLRLNYADFWNSSRAKPEEKWGANPWCWKISLILEENTHAR